MSGHASEILRLTGADDPPRRRRRWTALGAAAALATACTRASAPASGVVAARPPAPPASIRPDPEPWRSRPPPADDPGQLVFPAPEVRVLPSGLTLLVLPRDVGVVTIVAAVRRGASAVPPGRSGLAALTARMLVEGTRHRSTTELAAAAEDLGGVLTADAGRDYSYVSLTTLPEDLVAGLDLVRETLCEPAFDAVEFERVRSEWRSSLVEERQSPPRVASIVGLRLLAGPVLGAPVGGGIPDVDRLTRDDVAAFWRDNYRATTAAVVVVGGTSVAEVEPLVRTRFAGWGRAAPPPAPEEPRPAPEPPQVVVVDRPGTVQTALFVAQPMPARGAPGYEARLVMNAVLGGLFTSRLNQSLREEHAYTYGVSSSVIATRTWGGWVAATTVEASATAAALRGLVDEIDAIAGPAPRRPLTEAEVERARAALIHAQAARLADARDVAYELMTAFAQELPPDYPARYAELVRAVSRDDAARAAREHLHPERLIVVVIGDRRRFERELRAAWPRVLTAHPTLAE